MVEKITVYKDSEDGLVYKTDCRYSFAWQSRERNTPVGTIRYIDGKTCRVVSIWKKNWPSKHTVNWFVMKYDELPQEDY